MPETTTDAVVLTDIQDDVATITINRPEALNALNSDVLEGIEAAVADLQGKARGIVVTGAGPKAFVAGADIAEMVSLDADAAEVFSRRGQVAFDALAEFPGPVVAAINGFALGGGLELALACDILVASEKAKLGLPETTLGVVPGFGGTQRLPRRVGPGQAKRLVMTGQMVDAAEASRIGLVDLVVDAEDVLDEARGIVAAAIANGPVAVAEAKRLVDEGLEMKFPQAIRMEAESFGKVFATHDQEEGMQAFLEKRKPVFQGR